MERGRQDRRGEKGRRRKNSNKFAAENKEHGEAKVLFFNVSNNTITINNTLTLALHGLFRLL
jgi:hypothetical protein